MLTMKRSQSPANGTNAQVVKHRKEGDVALERALEKRISELGLMENKKLIEQQLANRLEDCISRRDTLCGVISRYKRRRPLKSGVLSATEEIRSIITPTIVRNDDGSKKEYAVKILMGYFTRDVRYTVNDNVISIRGACAAGQEGLLTKEIRIEFPIDVVMDMLVATYSAGVFRVVVPFSDGNGYHGNRRTALPSCDTDQENQSVTSSDDTHDVHSSLSDDNITWV